LIHLPLLADDNPIVRRISTVLPFLNLEYGPWVAGGICRRLADGETVIGNSDIDIFSPSEKVHEWVCSSIREHVRTFERPQWRVVNEFKHPKSNKFELGFMEGEVEEIVTFQFVKGRYYASADELLDDFDLTATMFATDGGSLLADDRAPAALAAKTLTLHRTPTRPTAARLAKYCAYGFTPGPGVLRDMFGVDLENFNPKETLTVDEY
jgi:hypothetical protein